MFDRFLYSRLSNEFGPWSKGGNDESWTFWTQGMVVKSGVNFGTSMPFRVVGVHSIISINCVIPAQAGIQMINNSPLKWDNTKVLPASQGDLLGWIPASTKGRQSTLSADADVELTPPE